MWRPRPQGPWGVYPGHQLTRDTESAGGTLPQILSGIFALFGPGIEFHPRGWHTRLNAEANVAVNLVRTEGAREAARSDFRIVLSHFRSWEARFRGLAGLVTRGRARHERFFTELDGSLGYYSRFQDNVIGYLQLQEGLHLVQWGPASLSGYWKLRLAKDTNRDFFNNVREGGGASLPRGKEQGGEDPISLIRSHREILGLDEPATYFSVGPPNQGPLGEGQVGQYRHTGQG